MSDETACKYVSSRGVLKSCVHRSPLPESSQTFVDWNLNVDNIKEGDTIYICSSALPDFVRRLLPHIKTRFILVSGDSDSSIPTGENMFDIPNHSTFKDQTLTPAEFNQLINSEYLIIWFSQNLTYDPNIFPKLRYLPIGLDYHTVANNDMFWGPRSSPKIQEDLLISIIKKARPLAERLHKAYTTCHFAMHRGTRQQAYNQIPKDLVYYEPEPVSRMVSWNKQIDYAFVVSPEGGGLDCHRAWEALCLGCIPIMISTPLNHMFDGLPVLIVKSWSDVTATLLEKTIFEYSQKEFSLTFQKDKLLLKYWLDEIQSYNPALRK
jgi:hypothetical protein